jgi:phosphopantothenoylcysteine synthetase/decarboxylase
MTDFFEEMLDAADALTEVDTGTTKSLSNLVRQVEELNKELDMAESHLKKLKQEKHKLQTDAIPALMDEMGVDRLDVGDVSVTLKPFVSASIPQDRRAEAHQWLRENGLDDIIKNDVVLSFGRGEDETAHSIMLDLEQRGFHPESKTHIHSMTLKAFVKERVEKGLPIDLDMFGAFVAKTADIKRK